MSDIIIVALIVGTTGVITPALLAYLAGRQRRQEKAEDYARQDAVADRVTDAAEKTAAVAEQAASAARLLLVDNRRVAAAAVVATEVVSGKLDQIHDLVNSNMTEALESQAAAIDGQLILARRLARIEPTADDAEDIRRLEQTLSELRAKLVDRAKQTEIADAKVRK